MHPYYLAMYMLVNGRWMKKSEAHECGLMAEVMPDWLTLRAGQQPITLPPFGRIMIYGSIGLNQDIAAQLLAKNFHDGNLSSPGDYVIEHAFVSDDI